MRALQGDDRTRLAVFHQQHRQSGIARLMLRRVKLSGLNLGDTDALTGHGSS